MAKELSVLQQQAEAIKTEVNKGANTSSRIGGMFGDMLEYNEEQSKIDEGNTGVSEYPEFSEQEEYKSGDVVGRNGKLYEFKVEHPAGSWNETHVEATSIKKIQDKKLTELDTKIGRVINFNGSSNYNEKINIELKKGDTLYLSVSEFNKTGDGDVAITYYSSVNRKYYCTVRGDGEKYYTAEEDITITNIQVNIASGVTNVSAIIKAGYGTIFENKKNVEDLSGQVKNINDNIQDIIDVQIGKTISFTDIANLPVVASVKGNFVKGQSISLITRNFSVQYTGTIALALYNPISKKYDVTFNGNTSFGNQTKIGNVSESTNEYQLQLIVSGGSISSVEGFAQISINQIENETYQEIQSFSAINNAIHAESSNYINNKGNSITGWIYGSKGSDVIFGVEKTSESDMILQDMSITLFSDDCNYDGVEFEFLVGYIDQRDWILYSRSFTAVAKKTTANNYKVTFDNQIFKKGEQLFVKINCLSSSGATVALDTTTYDSNNKVVYTTNINSAVTKDETKGYYNLVINTIDISSIFAYKEDLESMKDEVQTISSNLENSKIFTDTVTGDKYRIVVTNGELMAKSINYKKGLIIGNSYSNYGPSGTTWFSNNCMAASTESTQWFKLIEYKSSCQFTVKSGVDFERNYSTDYDFSSKLNLTDEYDVVIIQLGENSTYNDTMQASFTSLIKYIKSVCTKADIYVMLGAPALKGNRSTAITNAANSESVPIIDCMNVSLIGHYSLGDYVSSESNEVDYIQNSGVSDGHPSDIGELNIANKTLQAFGVETINDRLFAITLNQSTGGTITAAYTSWVSDGIVSIRCNADDGYDIQSIIVNKSSGSTVMATKRTNEYGTYYTFIMPKENITITPLWQRL